MPNKFVLLVLAGAALAFCSRTSLAQSRALSCRITRSSRTSAMRHHQGYVNNVNGFIEEDPSLAVLSLWKFMKRTEGGIFNNVAQIYNNNLYWNSLSPTGGGKPTGDVYTAIDSAFGSYEEFQTAFTAYASGHFGSGWVWLMVHEDGSVDVREEYIRVDELRGSNGLLTHVVDASTLLALGCHVVDSHDTENPVSEGLGFPLLVCDLWEHAYYLDYQNLRSVYIEGWWAPVNWEYAESEYARVLNKYRTTGIFGFDRMVDDTDDEAGTAAVDEGDAEVDDLSAAASDVFVHAAGSAAGVAGAARAASSAMLLLGL